MKRFMVLALTALVLTACSDKKEPGVTEVVSDVNINGVKSRVQLEITDYAMRAALGTNPNTGAYLSVQNKGDIDDRLVSVACACAGRAELHTMSMTDGMMEMAAVPEGFEIKAGQTLTLAPGGNHIMLFDLKTPVKSGDKQALLLTFEKAGSVTIDVPVSDAPLSKDH